MAAFQYQKADGDRFRQELPSYSPEYGNNFILPDDFVFMNHGSFGVDIVTALQGATPSMRGKNPNRSYFETGPIEVLAAHAYVGNLLDMPLGDYAFVQNTSEGVTSAFRTLLQNPNFISMHCGDEVLVTNHEYGACINQLKALLPDGATLVTAEIPFPISSPEEVVEAIFKCVNEKTRILFMSHVTSPTGLVFPIEEIVPLLEKEGIRCVIDGAHAPGMLPDLKPASYEASFYIGNLHKWLCAPPGSAFMYVKPDLQDHIIPPLDGWGVTRDLLDGELRWQARVMSRGVVDYRPWMDTPGAIEELKKLHPDGLNGITRFNQMMVREARDIVCKALGVDEPIAPDSMIGTLAAIPLPIGQRFSGETEVVIATLVEALRDHYKIEVPIISGFPKDEANVRISFHLYNDLKQYEYLGEALRDFFGIRN